MHPEDSSGLKTDISKVSQGFSFHDSTREPTRKADLLSQHGGVQVCDVARVPSKRPLGVQREGDGDRYVDGTRIVQ